jgi:aldehyde:ferredoxin oxidoreductase
MEFEQMTTPRGAHVGAAGSPSYDPDRSLRDFERHSERMGAPPDAIKRIVGETDWNPGRLSRYSEDWFSLFCCLSLCNRAWVNRFYHVKTITDFYTAVTGIETTPAELMRCAERAWTMHKLLNVRAGFSRKDDKPPEAWFQPVEIGGTEHVMTDYYRTRTLKRQDIENLLDDYYDERGWDIETGIPTPQKLKELGLYDEA